MEYFVPKFKFFKSDWDFYIPLYIECVIDISKILATNRMKWNDNIKDFNNLVFSTHTGIVMVSCDYFRGLLLSMQVFHFKAKFFSIREMAVMVPMDDIKERFGKGVKHVVKVVLYNTTMP